MDFEFDKEIDSLLRQSAQSEIVFATTNAKSKIQNPKSNHLNADEISAFAENALPEQAKQRSMLHLANCETCRKTLSRLITLNAEAEGEAVRVEEKQPLALPIPWYLKFFAFPNLAYTMGALVLVFSGIVAYTVLQNVNNSRNAEVSQISESQPNGKGMSSNGDAAPTESYSSSMMSNSNMMTMANAASMNSTSNTAAANFSNPAMPSAPMVAMNSNSATTRKDSDEITRAELKSLVPQEKPVDLAKNQDVVVTGAAPPSPAKENDYQLDAEAQRQQPTQAQQNSIAQNQTNITPDSRNVQSLPMLTRRAENKKLEESRNDAREKSKAATGVGGKTFKRTDNVWYDSAYRGQPTTNVTRGTNEYKKLDSGLRGIAENLGGTVVIVWKEKAYRIQ